MKKNVIANKTNEKVRNKTTLWVQKVCNITNTLYLDEHVAGGTNRFTPLLRFSESCVTEGVVFLLSLKVGEADAWKTEGRGLGNNS